MFKKNHFIGLDITSNTITLVAIKKQQSTVILLDYQQIYLPQPVLQQGYLIAPTLLLDVLLNLQKTYGKRFWYRIALSANVILQNKLTLPTQPLSTTDLNWLVQSALNTLFPVSAQDLSIDFCYVDANTLLITAAKKSETKKWQRLFQQAGLSLLAIDIMPAVLFTLAARNQFPADYLLLYWQDEQCLVTSPINQPFSFSLYNALSVVEILAHYHDYCGLVSNKSEDITSQPVPVISWSPFLTLNQTHLSLPALCDHFTLAVALALGQ